MARLSSKEAGYLIKMAARSGRVEVFNRATEMMARNDQV